MGTLVKKLFNSCNYFLWLLGFPDLSGNVFLITFKFSYIDYLTMVRKSNVNTGVSSFLVSLKYREIITTKTVTFYKKLYFFH